MSNAPDRLVAALAHRYRIERELGRGGMATVYLAQDLRHNRKVALKVLKPEVASVLGAERFDVEIRTTAALQHPHILPLFDSGSADGFLFYVMPYVEGETLRTKLDRETQLGVDEAVSITRDVADALDYAHRHGVIHRDIKPENILLHDGRPMVADFGIALALSAAAGTRMTETGLSLGTPHYMSPEQATAEKELTPRSDIYSLGSVLYEMLTGTPPHTGASAQQVIMKIVTEEATPVTRIRKAVPPNVAAAVAKAVERLPADRFESAAAFARALGDPSFHTTGARRDSGVTRMANRLSGKLGVAALVAGSFVIAAVGWLRPRPSSPILRYGLALPPNQAPVIGPVLATPAPDGTFLVYLGPGPGGRQLWIKPRDRYDATPVPGTAGATSFTLSPDGDWIAMIAHGRLSKLPVRGGAEVPLVSDDVGNAFGVAWLDDGTIVYSSRDAADLMRVSSKGGAASLAWRSDSLVALAPIAIPGGRGVTFQACTPGCPEPQVWVLDFKSGRAHLLVRRASSGEVVSMAGGLLLYSSEGGDLFAAPFDLGRLELTGNPVSLGIQTAAGLDLTAVLNPFHLSRNGTLTMLAGGRLVDRIVELVWVDRTGGQTPVDTTWRFRLTALANNHGWALSPDGSRVAVGVSSGAGDDIWVKPLPRGAPYRVTFDPGSDSRPRWTADSRYISFLATRTPGGLYLHRADGTGSDSLLYEGSIDEGLVTNDKRTLLLRQGSLGAVAGGRDITRFRIGIDSAPAPLLATSFDEEAIALSPDQKWLAYQSDETGRSEVFVRPYPDVDSDKKQVSSGGGRAPLWSRDGKELFFLSADSTMMSARLDPGARLDFADPVALFRVPDELLVADATYYTPWDVARDGRFLMVRQVAGGPPPIRMLVVVENWIEELKARLKR